MITDKQIAAVKKLEQMEISRDLISRVISAAMNIIYNSEIFESKLWPKRRFKIGFRSEIHKPDTILYFVRIEFNNGEPTWKAIYFNYLNKSKTRSIKQAKKIDLVLDHAIFDGVIFEKYPNHDYVHRSSECFFSGLNYTESIFNFNITTTQ